MYWYWHLSFYEVSTVYNYCWTNVEAVSILVLFRWMLGNYAFGLEIPFFCRIWSITPGSTKTYLWTLSCGKVSFKSIQSSTVSSPKKSPFMFSTQHFVCISNFSHCVVYLSLTSSLNWSPLTVQGELQSFWAVSHVTKELQTNSDVADHHREFCALIHHTSSNMKGNVR